VPGAVTLEAVRSLEIGLPVDLDRLDATFSSVLTDE